MKSIMKHEGDVTIFNLAGKFEGGTDCQDLREVFKDLILKGDRKFVINFQLVRWINSNGVGCLISAQKALDEAGGRLILCNLNRRNLSLIYTMRLEEVIEVSSSLKEALASLSTEKSQHTVTKPPDAKTRARPDLDQKA